MMQTSKNNFSSMLESRIRNNEGTVVYEKPFDHSTPLLEVEKDSLHFGWATLINGETTGGIYSYHPPIAKLISVAKVMIRELAEQEGFEEYIFPRHYTRENLHAFGWTEHKDLEQELMIIRPISVNGFDKRTNHETLADPVQCLGFYTTLLSLQKRLGGKLPATIFESGTLGIYEDQGGWTIRNELKSRLSEGWSTAFEFSGAEIVFAGLRQNVLSTRWSILCRVIDFLERLNMVYRVVVSTSCAREAAEAKLKNQIMPLFEIPTLDIELFIPQYVASRPSPWIELGGGDFAGTKLIENFNLQLSNEQQLYSGCQGFGWQRFALAFLSQHGYEPQSWPEEIRSRYGDTLPRNRLGQILNSKLEKDNSSLGEK